MSFFLSGGFPMVFVLVFGLVAIAGAVRFALAPAPGRIGPILAYSASVILVSLAGTAFDFVAVARYVATHDDAQAELAQILVMGASEALSPVILGFSMTGIVALVAAVGLRRMPVS